MAGTVVAAPQDRLTLLMKIQEKKHEYRHKSRPILWYISLSAIDLIIAIVAIIWSFNSPRAFNLFVIIALVCSFSFLVLSVFFVLTVGFGGINKIIKLISLKEEVDGLQTQLQTLIEYQAQLRSPHEAYREELAQTIIQYQRQANSYRRTHYLFQILIILFSLLVTTLTSGFTSLIGVIDKPWLPAVISFIVSFLTGMTILFRFHDRGFNLQQTADTIDYELKTSKLRIYDYSPPLTQEQVLHRLAERGAKLTDEQRKRQLQLEQASNNKHPSE